MDFQLALLLVVVGVIVIGFIYFDAKRRSKSRRDRVERELYEARIDNTRDKSGFDNDGVSQVRVRGGTKKNEPLVQEPVIDSGVTEEELSEPETASDDSFEQAKQEAWEAINKLPESAPAEIEPTLEVEPDPVLQVTEDVVSNTEEKIEPAVAFEAPVENDEPELIQEHNEPDFGDLEVPILDDALFEFDEASVKEPLSEKAVEKEPEPAPAPSPAPASEARSEPVVEPKPKAQKKVKAKTKPKAESPQQSLFGSEAEEVVEETVEKAPELIFSFFIVADSESSYRGEPLVHCLLEQGMRHGDMGIFHRHSQVTGRGPIQFSLANAFAPGTFDLDNLDQLETRGLALFMALPGPNDAMKAYDLMIQTARKITTTLGGQLLDASKSTFSGQIEAHHKEQIREYERQQLLNSRK